MHSKKLSAKARKAIRERMTPEQIAAEDRVCRMIMDDWRERHGFAPVVA